MTESHDRRTTDDDVRLRIFHPNDADRVRSLFVTAMSTASDSPIKKARWSYFTSLESLSCYFLVLTSAAISIFGPGNDLTFIFFTVVVGLRFDYKRGMLNKSLDKWLHEGLDDDLSDIVVYYNLWQIDEWEREYAPMDGRCFWVAEVTNPEGKNEVVGCVGLDVHYNRQGEPYGELQRLVVSPKYRRRSIAKKLMDELIAHGRLSKYPFLQLVVSDWQQAAIATCEKYGWSFIGHVHTYDGYTALTWNKYFFDLAPTTE